MNNFLIQEYWRIPEFFSKQCGTLWLPLERVQSDTRGFIAAILWLEQIIDRINMHRYLDPKIGGTSQLHDYLRSTGVAPEEAWRIANEVLDWLREARVPLSSREKAE